MIDIDPSGVLNLLMFGVTVWVATRLVFGLDAGRGGSVELLLRLTVIVALLVSWFGLLFLATSGAAVVLFLATCIVAVMTLGQIHVHRQRALVQLLALAVEKRMPLSAVVRAFGAEQPLRQRHRWQQFAARLQSGATLPQALQENRRLVPAQALVAVKIADSAGSLEAGLRHAARPSETSLALRQALAARTYYLSGMLFVGPMIITFVAIKIMPAFFKIFEDFEVEVPAATILLVRLLANPFVQLAAELAPVVAGALFLYVIAWNCGLAPAPTLGFRRLAERGNILRALALAVDSGRPLGEMLVKIADSYPYWTISARLRRVSDDVAAGRDWTESLVKHKLIGRSAAAAIGAAQRVGNLAWALRQLGDASDRRLLYRLQALLNVVSPLVILGLAAVVFVFVVGCFLPLVTLILSLT